MAAEAALWAILRRAKLPGHWVRVENRVERGTPDVNYVIDGVEGWIELKSLGHLAADPRLPLRIRHYTKQQRFWAIRRARAGGHVALLIRVERGPKEYMLIPGEWGARNINKATPEEVRGASLGVWGPAWDRRSFLEALALVP